MNIYVCICMYIHFCLHMHISFSLFIESTCKSCGGQFEDDHSDHRRPRDHLQMGNFAQIHPIRTCSINKKWLTWFFGWFTVNMSKSISGLGCLIYAGLLLVNSAHDTTRSNAVRQLYPHVSTVIQNMWPDVNISSWHGRILISSPWEHWETFAQQLAPRLQAAMGVAHLPRLLHIFLGIVAASWVETINQAGMQSLGTTGRGR